MKHLALVLAFLTPYLGVAQPAVFRGRVLVDSSERPVSGATVALEALRLQATSDSLGNVVIFGIQPGVHVLTVRRPGFSPLTAQVAFTAGATVEADLLVTQTTAQPLPEVTIETRPVVRGKMAEFEERRTAGLGRFLTQEQLMKSASSSFVDVLRSVMAIELIRSPTGEVYAAAGRMSVPGCALCGPARSANNTTSCFVAVVLDGTMVYGGGGPNEPKYDLNWINPGTLAGVEYYVGPASIPVRYNATRNTCGLLMLWTK